MDFFLFRRKVKFAGLVSYAKRKSRRPDIARLVLAEILECRRFLSATPTDFEQYMLGLINRARANPSSAAASLGIDLNQGLAAGTISSAPVAPLAFNPDLVQSAQDYSATLLGAYNYFGYDYNNTTPQSRMAAAGYVFSGSYTSTEDLYDVYHETPQTVNLASTNGQYDGLFIDSEDAGRVGRMNLLDAAFKEVGIGIMSSNTYQGIDVPPDHTDNPSVLTAIDFAASGADPNPFLTGVVFTDLANTQFYAPGEGIGNATITATRASDNMTFTATTWSGGGYSLAVPAGTYTVVASGGGLSTPVTQSNVVVAAQNVEEDFIAPSAARLAGSFAGAIPTAPLVVGQKTKVAQSLVLSNSGTAALSETASVAYYLSVSGSVGSNAIALPGTVNKALKLKPGAKSALRFKLASVPSGIASGSYYIVAQITAGGTTTDVATASTLTVEPAQINLTGAFVKASPTVKNGKAAPITISVTNDGNIPAIGALPIQLDLSTTGIGDPSPIALPLTDYRLKLQPGKTAKVALHAVISGVANDSYFVLVSLDPGNMLSGINAANYTFASATAAISVTG